MEAEEFRNEALIPFIVGMVSLAWTVVVISRGGSEYVACVSLPGVIYANWKLAPFLWGWRQH